MNKWRNIFLLRFVSMLMLLMMTINPALALQYQQYNQIQNLLSQIPDFEPRAWHIHVSQKEQIFAELRNRGYDLIPASKQQAELYLNKGLELSEKPIQLAANFNLKRVFLDGCSYKTKLCHAEECDKYPKQRRKDCPEPEPVKQTQPQTTPENRTKKSDVVIQPRISTTHSGSFNIPKVGGGGGGRDAAAVMLVVIGVVVIAALFIYAGKWIADQLSNDEDYYAYWWDIGSHYISLDTDTGERGSFTGLKLSGGFVPNMHTNFGITFEIGRMHLNLLYNPTTQAQRIQVDGSYWMIGPSVRWLLKNNDDQKFIHNTYIFLELLGGGSDRDEVDKMAMARIGINTAVQSNIRLGIHYGAFYLGLNEDKGFANDGDNYWNMYGFELGYHF